MLDGEREGGGVVDDGGDGGWWWWCEAEVTGVCVVDCHC